MMLLLMFRLKGCQFYENILPNISATKSTDPCDSSAGDAEVSPSSAASSSAVDA